MTIITFQNCQSLWESCSSRAHPSSSYYGNFQNVSIVLTPLLGVLSLLDPLVKDVLLVFERLVKPRLHPGHRFLHLLLTLVKLLLYVLLGITRLQIV